MKRIALVLALATGSQGCLSANRRSDDKFMLLGLVTVAATIAAAVVLSQTQQPDPNPRIPEFPPPPEQQPQPPF